MNIRKSKKGFSLVELLVVITIIAILSVTAYMALGGQTIKAKNSKRMQDLSTLQSALEVYFIENGEYPADPLTSGNGAGEVPKRILSEIPQDPDEVDYFYWEDDISYILGASIETTDTDASSAHVVGNHEGGVGGGKDQIDGTGNNCNVEIGVTTCYPVALP